MNKQEKPPKRAPYRPAQTNPSHAASPSGRSFRLRVSGRGVKAFALFAIRWLWKILRFALTELYIILFFRSAASLSRDRDKIASSQRGSFGGGGGYDARGGHGEVDLPWVKHDRK